MKTFLENAKARAKAVKLGRFYTSAKRIYLRQNTPDYLTFGLSWP